MEDFNKIMQVQWRHLLYFVLACTGWTVVLLAHQSINPSTFTDGNDAVMDNSRLFEKTPLKTLSKTSSIVSLSNQIPNQIQVADHISQESPQNPTQNLSNQSPQNLPQQLAQQSLLKNSQNKSQVKSQEHHLPLAYPLLKKVTPSSSYGVRIDPFSHQLGNHEGIDLPAIKGTPILASASGKVVAAGYDAGYGNSVTIDHGNGFITKYGHADQLLVKIGQSVDQSQSIALVGSTGKSTGPHLHFEIRKNDQFLNPTSWMLSNQGFDLGTPIENAQNSSVQARAKTQSNLARNQINHPTKPNQNRNFYQTGDLVAVVRVRSGKLVQ